jgi:hypothetical protein
MEEIRAQNKWRYVLKEGLKLGLIIGTLMSLAEVLIFEKLPFQDLMSFQFLLKWGGNLVLFSIGMCFASLWQWNGKK